MRTQSATLAVVAPFALASGLTLAQTFPEVEISKAEWATEWPFVVDEGTLTCVELGPNRTVIFSEPWREDVPQEIGNMTLPRSVIVSANPFAILASLEDRSLFLPFDTLETLIRRLAPFETSGLKLCDAATKTSH
jgi:hypothetical protein